MTHPARHQPPRSNAPLAARRREASLPPMWVRGPHPSSPLLRFVLLSMLLHALALLLFGAPGGGTRAGRALWGSLDVLILKPAPAPAVERPERALPTPSPSEARPPPLPAPPPAPSRPAARADFPFPPLLDRLSTPSAATMEPAPRVPLPTDEGAVAHTSTPPAPQPEQVPEAPKSVVLPPALPALEPVPETEVPPAIVAVPTLPALEPVEAAVAIAAPVRVEALPIPAPAPLAIPEALPAIDARTVSSPMSDAPALEEPAPRAAPPSVAREATPSPFRTSPPQGRSGEAMPYDPTAPALDPEALRKRAGELAREGSGNRALLAFPMPAVPPRKSKLESAIENARKPDCRTAYQSLGLAAIVPLIANELGEGHCRW